MQENIKIYEQMLMMKKYHNKYVSRFGPFGEHRIINKPGKITDHNHEHEWNDDYSETI